MATSRNRVIYQSEALFVGAAATGYHATGEHVTAGAPGANPGITWTTDGVLTDATVSEQEDVNAMYTGIGSNTIVRQLKRVQNANYSFTVNRTDVNQFGQLSRIDSLVTETPTVSLDFSYLLTDGENERLLNFAVNGETNSLSGHMDPMVGGKGQNFFILTVPEGQDAVKGDQNDPASNTVISLGNGFISDYSIEAAVGALPTASVTVEGFNIKSNTSLTGDGTVGQNDGNATGVMTPAIDPNDGSKVCSRWFALPQAETGDGITALRPGDITLDLQNAALFSKQVDGNTNNLLPGAAHVQSVSISVPMSRSVLQRLGNTFGFSREIDFPVNVTVSVNALVSELKNGDMLDLLCGDDKKDLKITMRNPECVTCERGENPTGMIFEIKGAILESESYSSSIGDNKSVDLTYTAQIGGATDTTKGLFISGATTHGKLPRYWNDSDMLINDGY